MDTDRVLVNDTARVVPALPVEVSAGVVGSVQATSSLYFPLLKPVSLPDSVPTKDQVLYNPPTQDLPRLFGDDEVLALDIETNGTRCYIADAQIVGIGLAGSSSLVYYSDSSLYEEAVRWLSRSKKRLVCHNIYFEMQWFLQFFPDLPLNWYACTYGMFRYLENSGYLTLKYGLKDAQQTLLGWEVRGDVELDEWLVTHGYYKGNKRSDESPEALLIALRAGKLRPDKGKMHLAPVDILGYYCVLDCASTYLLATEVFFPASQRLPPDARIHHDVFITNALALAESRVHGFWIDKPRLDEHVAWLTSEVEKARLDFLTHPDILEGVITWTQNKLTEHLAKEPTRLTVAPKLGQEPAALTKFGKPSKNWLKWQLRKNLLEEGKLQRETAAWTRWHTLKLQGEEELRRLKLGQVLVLESAVPANDTVEESLAPTAETSSTSPDSDDKQDFPQFNINSTHHRSWLFFEHLGVVPKLFTATGQPAVDKKALKSLGEHGQRLKHYNDLVKELQMVLSVANALCQHPDGSWRVHAGYRVPGTFTGRLSGADGVNLQQLPKRKEYLSCWIPRPGWVMLDCDVTALEPVVLTGLSKDRAMLSLYGPSAPKGQDIYLYVGANLPGIGDAIRATGYDPDNSTPESVAHAKKLCKKERGVAKVVVLGCLEEGTLVRVKDQGWKNIEHITADDVVWDGEAWVTTEGVVYKGKKECLALDGITLTPDHEVLTNAGWQVSERTSASSLVRHQQPSASWADVWAMVCRIGRDIKSRWL